MNALKKLETSEIAQLKEAMLNYYGYIISSQHGIIHIGNTKNKIITLKEKATTLKQAQQKVLQLDDTIKKNEIEVADLQNIIRDIQNEIIESQDPRFMLDLKTLEVTKKQKEQLHSGSVSKLSTASSTIYDIIKNSIDNLDQQIKSLELMIALMN